MKAIVIDKDDASYRAAFRDIDEAMLPAGDVTVRIEYSTINYKDGLAIMGGAPVVRSFPMVPGIDFAGVVEQSTDSRYRAGDRVLLNGWGTGEVHWGGLAEKARVPGDWLLPVPEGLTTRQAMAIGTAGYTAMLCVLALEDHGVVPARGDVVVTGAAGGVGSVAIALLSRLGYRVVAVSGRPEASDYLRALGASDIIARSDLNEPGKPLQKERWAGAVDAVGSHMLANICAQLHYGGVVAACGMAGGADLPASVMPFILRGVTLAGVDSVMCPRERRIVAWNRLARDLDLDKLETMIEEIGLEGALAAGEDVLAGRTRGRTVVAIAP
jgi:acrylyl-CoA reductase (NADPH)